MRLRLGHRLAAPNANRNGLHFEHAGRAAQTAKDWADPYSRKMLLLSAELQAKKSTQYGIPVVKLTPVQIRAGKLGFCGHRDVTPPRFQAPERIPIQGLTSPGPSS